MAEVHDRFWYRSISMMLSKLSKKRAGLMLVSEFEKLKELYERCGGTWEGLAEGDSESWELLKTCCKEYFVYCKDRQQGPIDPERIEQKKRQENGTQGS